MMSLLLVALYFMRSRVDLKTIYSTNQYFRDIGNSSREKLIARYSFFFYNFHILTFTFHIVSYIHTYNWDTFVRSQFRTFSYGTMNVLSYIQVPYIHIYRYVYIYNTNQIIFTETSNNTVIFHSKYV